MAVIAFASAKGAPGVTALAVAAAALWPRPCVLADCDPAGGDIALRYRDEQDDLLDVERGLLSLAAAARRGGDTDLGPHVQVIAGGLPVLVGTTGPTQVAGMGTAWPHVARAFSRHPDADVVVDCGRVALGAPTQALLEGADAVVFAVRPTVEQLAHLRERLRALAAPLGLERPDGVPTGVVVTAPQRDASVVQDVEQLLAASGLDVPVVGHVADDAKGVLAVEQRRPRAGRSAFVRSVRGVVPSIDGLVRVRRLQPA